MASVVQRLQALGHDTSFNGRKSLYGQFGLGNNFSGTAQQNLALATEAERRGQGGAATPAATPASPTASPQPTDPFPGYLSQAQGQYKPLLDANQQSITAQRAGNTQNYNDLAARLKENAGYASGALGEQMNNFGLLQSGRTAAGLGQVQRELAQNLSQADIQRSIADADLALKQAGFTTDTGAAEISRANQLSGGSLGTRQFQTQQAGQLQNLLLSPLYHNIPDEALRQILQSYGFSGNAQ